MNGNPSAGGIQIPFWEWEWAEQHKFLQQSEHNFVANEHCIGQHFIIAEGIRYVTILRDPLDRTYSHFLHEVRGYTEGASDGDPHAPPQQIQPEIWVDLLSLCDRDQMRWADRIQWEWTDNALLEKCREWTSKPYDHSHLLEQANGLPGYSHIRDAVAAMLHR